MALQVSQLVLSPFISEYSLEQEEKGQEESLQQVSSKAPPTEGSLWALLGQSLRNPGAAAAETGIFVS